MTDIETIRKIAEYAPHWLTPEDRRALRDHDPVIQKRARRWPIYGAILCILALAALPVFADPVGALSTVDIGPSAKPGAYAEVTFHNDLEPIGDEVVIDLGNGIKATFSMEVGDIPDRMSVTVPEGYVASPEYVDVHEGTSGTVVIYSVEGVGV